MLCCHVISFGSCTGFLHPRSTCAWPFIRAVEKGVSVRPSLMFQCGGPPREPLVLAATETTAQPPGDERACYPGSQPPSYPTS